MSVNRHSPNDHINWPDDRPRLCLTRRRGPQSSAGATARSLTPVTTSAQVLCGSPWRQAKLWRQRLIYLCYAASLSVAVRSSDAASLLLGSRLEYFSHHDDAIHDGAATAVPAMVLLNYYVIVAGALCLISTTGAIQAFLRSLITLTSDGAAMLIVH
jgi:hypothetical protein